MDKWISLIRLDLPVDHTCCVDWQHSTRSLKVEQRPYKPQVLGSIPSGSTMRNTEPTVTESLLDLARSIRQGGDKLIVSDDVLTEADYARIKLGLRLLCDPALAFRLIVEDLDLPSVVREVH